MVGLFQETGPCEVVEIAKGKLGTQARAWGWDRSSNMLFIDQPNQVGFSYDITSNGTLNLLNSTIGIPPTAVPQNQPASNFLNGTFPSNDYRNTPNTTDIAAHAVWHMLQGFLGAFPQYNPGTRPNSTQSGVVGVNLFAESYGGKYGPSFASLWERQNMARRNGSLAGLNVLEIRLTSLGIMQGCVDDSVQGQYYPLFAYNNSYGIQAITQQQELTTLNSFRSAKGCQQLTQSCKDSARSMDPSNNGDVATVNQICEGAQQSCNTNVVGPFENSGRDVYDIAQMVPNSFPPSTYLDYLNSKEVQASIGAMVNYTESSRAVSTAFLSTGDYDRGDQLTQIASLLALGVRVAFIYGDRDYICNWIGGEAIAFSVAAQSPATAPFYSAGYAPIVVNSSYIGGVVRQFGNLSFSRIYDAGHLIPAYQPETAFTLFTRVIMGTDISTGEPIDLSKFATTGPANATFQNTPPSQSNSKCWIRNIPNSCTERQKLMWENGQGVTINGVLYDRESDWEAPASSLQYHAGMPGTYPSSTTATTATSNGAPMAVPTSSVSIPTGVYVATATPITSGKKPNAGSKRLVFDLPLYCITLLLLIGATVGYI